MRNEIRTTIKNSELSRAARLLNEFLMLQQGAKTTQFFFVSPREMCLAWMLPKGIIQQWFYLKRGKVQNCASVNYDLKGSELGSIQALKITYIHRYNKITSQNLSTTPPLSGERNKKVVKTSESRVKKNSAKHFKTKFASSYLGGRGEGIKEITIEMLSQNVVSYLWCALCNKFMILHVVCLMMCVCVFLYT